MKMLQTLSDAVGVSGQEDAVRALVLGAIRPHVTDVRINALGGITALQRGTGERRLRVMLAAHMDEIGLLVTGFEGDGLIRFVAVGGIDDRILPGKRVRIGSTPGVIVWTPIHKNQDQNAVRISSLRIDIGATSKDEAARKVKRGERIAFDSTFTELDGGRMLRGKAFDDRAGCELLIDVLQGGPYPVDVLAAFTVQEEIGLRGARVAAYSVAPDVAFALEGTIADDLPKETDVSSTTELGKGPAISVMDRSAYADRRLVELLVLTAQEHGIPYQIKQPGLGGTDAGTIHLAREGIPSTALSVPCRYIHAPAALMDPADVLHTIELLAKALVRLPSVWGK